MMAVPVFVVRIRIVPMAMGHRHVPMRMHVRHTRRDDTIMLVSLPVGKGRLHIRPRARISNCWRGHS
jgi:hypothetical protein